VLPFELHSGFLVVMRGDLENLKGLRFIVDTGSTHSLIDQTIANRLHLKRRVGGITTLDGDTPIEWAEATDLKVGPVRLNRAQILVTNLARYSEFAKNIDGIIGLDLLSRCNQLTIDYKKRTVSFQLVGDVDDRFLPDSFQIPIVIQGVPMFVVVDTGFQGLLLYADRLRKRLPNIYEDGKPKPVRIGRIQATEVRLPGVEIAGPQKLATVWLVDGLHTKLTPLIDGFVGPAYLHVSRVELDFSAKRLRCWQ
jgi:predicted aspartyl protease